MTVVFGAGDVSIRDNAATILIHENQALKFINELEELYGKHALFVSGRKFIQEGYMALHKGLKFKQQEEVEKHKMWELREEPKEEPKDIAKSNKAKEIYDHYYHLLLENSLNNNQSIFPEGIKSIASKITQQYFKGLDELGNSPWDPR